jgi:hypothetical protein
MPLATERPPCNADSNYVAGTRNALALCEGTKKTLILYITYIYDALAEL